MVRRHRVERRSMLWIPSPQSRTRCATSRELEVGRGGHRRGPGDRPSARVRRPRTATAADHFACAHHPLITQDDEALWRRCLDGSGAWAVSHTLTSEEISRLTSEQSPKKTSRAVDRQLSVCGGRRHMVCPLAKRPGVLLERDGPQRVALESGAHRRRVFVRIASVDQTGDAGRGGAAVVDAGVDCSGAPARVHQVGSGRRERGAAGDLHDRQAAGGERVDLGVVAQAFAAEWTDEEHPSKRPRRAAQKPPPSM